MNPRDHQTTRFGRGEPIVPAPFSALPDAWRVAAVASVAIFSLILITPVQAQTARNATALMQQAEAGNASAELDLGNGYQFGEDGLPKNPLEAVKWYRKAAGHGLPQAEFALGFFYVNGKDGLPKNPLEAVKWYRKAAAQGFPQAEFNLGVVYGKGKDGLPKNRVEAMKWFRKAAAQGFRRAIAVLQRLQHPPQQAVATTPPVAAPPPAPAARAPVADNQQTLQALQALQRFWTLYFQASNAHVADFGEPALVQPVGFGGAP